MSHSRSPSPCVLLAAVAALLFASALNSHSAQRTTLSLNGTWQIAEGGADSPPAEFDRTIPVPGLVDLARPAFSDVGFKSPKRAVFWYRRTFHIDGSAPEIALLKIHKACYGAAVILNGHTIGEHLPCFTPGYFDLKPFLKSAGENNELLIRVGADRDSLPQDMPTGWDFEKYRFIPGIFDSVELILSKRPFIANIQTVPDLANQSIRVVAEIDSDQNLSAIDCQIEVLEWRTQKVVASQKASIQPAKGLAKLDAVILLPGARFWTPEDPFLYELRLATAGDSLSARFGMRTFAFDPQTKRALLNGKTYYLRGSNVTLYRFFEDASRSALPWDPVWVRRFHQKLKTMNWNALRYCIGFPPEIWYQIADEEGFLIQDEFPIWLLGGKRDHCPEWPVAEKIIPQYTEWMRERWNHPCVAIWDAQNESFTPETGKALSAVRHLDLSHRPWENGWSEPQLPTDCVEAHPYLFIGGWMGKQPFHLSEMPKISGRPNLQKPQQRYPTAIIINEYGWLWLTREGQPTCLTAKIYENLLGTNATPSQRRQLYARYLSAKTEFWRAHRECAGVLHFCALGYSRPGDKPRPEGGATSDHWADVRKLKFEPFFEEYMRDAFNPLGLMLDFWDETVPAGSQTAIEIYVINDRDQAWNGTVRLQLLKLGKTLTKQTRPLEVPALGRQMVRVTQSFAAEPGHYELSAELTDPSGKIIRSRREFEVQRFPEGKLSIGLP